MKQIYILQTNYRILGYYYDESTAKTQQTKAIRQGYQDIVLRKIPLTDDQIISYDSNAFDNLYKPLLRAFENLPVSTLYFRPKVSSIKGGLCISIVYGNLPFSAVLPTPEQETVMELVCEKRLKEFHKQHPNMRLVLKLNKQKHLELQKVV